MSLETEVDYEKAAFIHERSSVSRTRALLVFSFFMTAHTTICVLLESEPHPDLEYGERLEREQHFCFASPASRERRHTGAHSLAFTSSDPNGTTLTHLVLAVSVKTRKTLESGPLYDLSPETPKTRNGNNAHARAFRHNRGLDVAHSRVKRKLLYARFALRRNRSRVSSI